MGDQNLKITKPFVGVSSHNVAVIPFDNITLNEETNEKTKTLFASGSLGFETAASFIRDPYQKTSYGLSQNGGHNALNGQLSVAKYFGKNKNYQILATGNGSIGTAPKNNQADAALHANTQGGRPNVGYKDTTVTNGKFAEAFANVEMTRSLNPLENTNFRPLKSFKDSSLSLGLGGEAGVAAFSYEKLAPENKIKNRELRDNLRAYANVGPVAEFINNRKAGVLVVKAKAFVGTSIQSSNIPTREMPSYTQSKSPVLNYGGAVSTRIPLATSANTLNTLSVEAGATNTYSTQYLATSSSDTSQPKLKPSTNVAVNAGLVYSTPKAEFSLGVAQSKNSSILDKSLTGHASVKLNLF